jgi:hypothetical protein
MLSIAFLLVVSSVDVFSGINIVYKPSYCMLIGTVMFALGTGKCAFSISCRKNFIYRDSWNKLFWGRSFSSYFSDSFQLNSILRKDNTKNEIVLHNVMAQWSLSEDERDSNSAERAGVSIFSTPPPAWFVFFISFSRVQGQCSSSVKIVITTYLPTYLPTYPPTQATN